jgi:hypothetical protein
LETGISTFSIKLPNLGDLLDFIFVLVFFPKQSAVDFLFSIGMFLPLCDQQGSECDLLGGSGPLSISSMKTKVATTDRLAQISHQNSCGFSSIIGPSKVPLIYKEISVISLALTSAATLITLAKRYLQEILKFATNLVLMLFTFL